MDGTMTGSQEMAMMCTIVSDALEHEGIDAPEKETRYIAKSLILNGKCEAVTFTVSEGVTKTKTFDLESDVRKDMGTEYLYKYRLLMNKGRPDLDN